MATCSTSRWVSTAPYIKLTVTLNTTGDTANKYDWKLQYISSYAANTSSARSYTVKIDGTTVKSGTYDIDGKTGTKTIASGTTTVNRTKSAREVKIYCSMDFNLTWRGEYAGTKSASDTFTLNPITSYKVTYNGNGGSGVPSADTKWHNETLSLDFGTVPTRTGYTFLGYSTSSTATSATWTSSSKSYTANASDVLYAVWKENYLTVNYYSNYATYAAFKGGEISVSASTNVLVYSQQFYYDNECSSGLADVQNTNYIYLSRTGYAPTGYWGTSSNGGTLVNQSTAFSTGQALAQALGKSLASGNASVNVYAQWQENAYILTYDSNGGFGEMGSQTIEWGELFTLSNNTFEKLGYKFIGWNAYRNSDNTWYATGQGWKTEDEIISNGYSKKLYEDQCELTFDTSWIRENEEARLYTMYAVWELFGGIVYIDNGSTFEPYLTYIDNGTSWDLYLAYVDNGTNWETLS